MKIKRSNSIRIKKAYLPENLCLETLVKEYDPKLYGISEFNVDHAIYLLSLLSETIAGNKQLSDTFDPFDTIANYINLSSEKMQSYVRHYKAYLTYFQQIGVIECNNYYIISDPKIGRKGESLGYRFSYKYQESNLVFVEYSKTFSDTLVRKYQKYIDSLYLQYGHLTKWLSPSNLEIDNDTAFEYITIRRDAQLANPNLRDKWVDSVTGDIKIKDPVNQYKWNSIGIQKIDEGNLNGFVDETVTRLHSTITNLKKEIRNLIFYRKNNINHRLVSIDIVNSQPYISSILLNKNNKGKISQLITNNKRLNNNILNQTINNNLPQSFPMLEKAINFIENQQLKRKDLKLYIQLVTDSPNKPVDKDGKPLDLYTYMLQECKRHKLNVSFGDRKAIKLGMFGVMFGIPERNTETKKLFAKLFPTVWKVFCIIKKNNKRDLSCLLQQLEASLILLNVTKVFAKKHPNVPIFTIHDSIITLETHRKELHRIMKVELTKLVGYPPMLEEEIWKPEEIDWEKYSNAIQETVKNSI